MHGYSSVDSMQLFIAPRAGLGIFSLFYILPNTRRYLDAVRSNFSGCVRTQTVLSAILGGGILGIGITLAGSVSYLSCASLSYRATDTVPWYDIRSSWYRNSECM